MVNKASLCVAVISVAALAACEMQPQEEFVIQEPEVTSVEPTYTGKY